MVSKKLLLAPAVVVMLAVPAGDASAGKRNHGKSADAPGHARADEKRPAFAGDGRRMR